MSFDLSMVLRLVGADKAQAALKGTEAALKKTSAAATEAGRSEGVAAGASTNLKNASLGAAGAVNHLATAEAMAAQNALNMGRANKVAAGNMGNLVAQFNDIGIMMAAGQNPLQLALQQGTQISQVIGPMGAAGAVRALGGAFLGMLNPVSLITIGSIAAGAAMVGWLRDAAPEAVSLDDVMDKLADSLKSYREAVDQALKPTEDLSRRFGDSANLASRVIEQLALGKQAKGLREITEAASALSQSFDVENFPNQNVLAELFDLSVWDRNSRKSINQVIATLDQLGASGSLEQQKVAAMALLETFEAVAKSSGGISVAEQGFVDQIGQLILNIAELEKTSNDGAGVSRERIRRDYETYYESRIRGEERLASIRQRELSEADRIYGYYAKSRTASDEAVASADAMLAKLRDENALREAIQKHGAGSAEVAALRAAQEQAVFDKAVALLNVSEATKHALHDAFKTGQSFAMLDLASGVSSAATAAADLAQKLGISLGLAQKIIKSTGKVGDPNPTGFDALDPRNGRTKGVWNGPYSRDWQQNPDRNSGSGGKSETERQAEALARLIASERDQLAILRATNPVEREMLKNREALSGATKQQTQTVEDLIATRLREQAQMDALQESYDFWGQTTLDVFDQLTISGKGFDDMLGSLAQSLAKAAWQATILGTGPLASPFGTSGGNGLFGSIWSGVFGLPIPAKAGGGPITGPGGPTDDQVLMFGSNGEYMVNAAATSKHRGLLEAINSGAIDRLPGFAAGGAIGAMPMLITPPPGFSQGAGSRSLAGTGAPETTRIELHLSDDIDARIVERAGPVSLAVFKKGIEQYSNEALVHRVKQIANDERATG